MHPLKLCILSLNIVRRGAHPECLIIKIVQIAQIVSMARRISCKCHVVIVLKNLTSFVSNVSNIGNQCYKKKGGVGLIYLYSGTPGSGKSLHCARVMANLLKINRPLIANFPIDLTRFSEKKAANFLYLPDAELKPDKLVKFSQDYFAGNRPKEGHITVVIDVSIHAPM